MVERALSIADRDGLAAVTIRRVAAELDVTPMALYWHVAGKEDLLAEMGDRLFAGLPPQTDPNRPWSVQLDQLVTALTAALRAHPAAAALAAPRILQNEQGCLLTERVLALLAAGGFAPQVAAEIARHALRNAISLVSDDAGSGPAADEASAADEAGAAERAEQLRRKRQKLAALPADRFPRLVQSADALTQCADLDDYYRLGVGLLIAGVEEMSRRPEPGSGA